MAYAVLVALINLIRIVLRACPFMIAAPGRRVASLVVLPLHPSIFGSGKQPIKFFCRIFPF